MAKKIVKKKRISETDAEKRLFKLLKKKGLV